MDDLAQKLGMGDGHNSQVNQQMISVVAECFDKVRSGNNFFDQEFFLSLQLFSFPGSSASTKFDLSSAASRFVFGDNLQLKLIKLPSIQNPCLSLGFKVEPTWFRSDGLTGVFHSSLLGVYTMDDYNNGANITHNSRFLNNVPFKFLQRIF